MILLGSSAFFSARKHHSQIHALSQALNKTNAAGSIEWENQFGFEYLHIVTTFLIRNLFCHLNPLLCSFTVFEHFHKCWMCGSVPLPFPVMTSNSDAELYCSIFLTYPAKDLYRLHLGESNGNAGDALADLHTTKQPAAGSSLAGVKFSTYDKQPDGDGKCIRHNKSGWWFSRSKRFLISVNAPRRKT